MSLREHIQRYLGQKAVKSAGGLPAAGGPPTHIFWGMRDIPIQDATQHFLVAGSPQSGKTITLRLLMESIIPFVGRGYQQRAFVYDAKREFLPLLTEMWGKPPTTLDPFDERGHPWDMAADITTEADAVQLAGMLIPEEPNATQRYFSDAARDLLRAVLVAFIETAPRLETGAGRWTFRDVLLALENVQLLTQIVHKSEPSARIAARYLEDEKSLPSVVSTIATKLLPFSVVAALWANSKQKPLSLAEWLNTEGVLVMASHPRYSESLRPLNQAIFRRISDLVLSRPDTDPEEDCPWRTWFFLDEVREAGQLNGLHPLLNTGRSKGACMAIGFQDIAGMYAVYGEQIAHELTGQCAYKTFLRTASQVTALWAQAHFGQAERVRAKFSESKSYDKYGSLSGSQSNINYDRVLENALLASELLSIPAPGPKSGLIGFHDTPRDGAYRSHAPWDWIMNNLWKPSQDVVESVLKVSQRDAVEQKLQPWNNEDFMRLWPGDGPPKDQQGIRKATKKGAGRARQQELQWGIFSSEADLESAKLVEPAPPISATEREEARSSDSDSKAETEREYQAKKAEMFKIKLPEH